LTRSAAISAIRNDDLCHSAAFVVLKIDCYGSSISINAIPNQFGDSMDRERLRLAL